MITELQIKNFAIIDDLSIPFVPGLNVLTGETGAGKSIIIEALGMITGDRINSDVIRSGENGAEVTAIFDMKRVSKELVRRLGESSHEIGEHLVFKRGVLNSGKSKAFLNGKPISLAELKSISPLLLEISSQHEHQRLLNEESHLEIVDRFGGLYKNREEYKSEYVHYINVKTKLAELEMLTSSKNEQRAFLTYQINEIETADLKKDDDENLEREKKIIKHAADLFDKLNQSEQLLYSSETSITGALDKVGELIAAAAEIDDEVKGWLPLSEQASVAAQELARSLQDYLKNVDVDPGRLEEVEERLYEIGRLKKKYGGTVEAILAKRTELSEKLNMIDNCDQEIKKLTEEKEAAYRELQELASKLSNTRAKSAEKLSKMVQIELDSLGLIKTTFAPGHVKLNFDQADEFGVDRFSFMISPNPGEPLKPMSRIASGGELSRIMLAVKNVLLDKVGLAALEVFDEVDVGIGGANAEVVGKKLKQMSLKRQIICITHLPQVASFGGHHIVVSKEARGKRTVTCFRLLDERSRVGEIARMLDGVKITKTTVEHAKEMLKRGVQ